MESFLFRRWWEYSPIADPFSTVYHAFNLVEGVAWIVCARLVFSRWWRKRNSALEPLYAAAFLTFAATDFREAYLVEGWLILLKGLNLAVLLWLRRLILTRFYPECRAI